MLVDSLCQCVLYSSVLYGVLCPCRVDVKELKKWEASFSTLLESAGEVYTHVLYTAE